MNLASPDVVQAALGGALIGLAAAWLYLALGRIAGISGIAAQALRHPIANSWAVLFLVGLGLGGWIANGLGLGTTEAVQIGELSWPLLLVGGLLVGVGTRLGSGCTSGHGVCGIARLSYRSITATGVFMVVGMLTATLVHGS